MSRQKSKPTKADAGQGPRRAREIVGRGGLPPEVLFRGFWRAGEMALLFGAVGVGKSFLAVQIADALARGRAIAGIEMPRRRRKVLYVDLILSDAQFRSRYSWDGAGNGRIGRYIFSQNLYRERPPEDADLAKWIEEMCSEHRFSVVFVDDLSAVSRSSDGTRETLRLMRELKRLSLNRGLSVMVLADSAETPHTRSAGEADLKRSRILCSVADSAILLRSGRGDDRRLFQTRSQSFGIEETVLTCTLTEFESGLVGFEFERPVGQLSDEELARVLKAKELHEKGSGVRAIGAEMGVSKSTAARLLQKWAPDLDKRTGEHGGHVSRSPAMDGNDADAAGDRYGTDLSVHHARSKDADVREAGSSDPNPRKEISDDGDEDAFDDDAFDDDDDDDDDEGAWLAALDESVQDGRSIYDLDTRIDAYGREIFVESEDAQTRKPLVWYTRGRTGSFTRHERKASGVQIQHLGTSEWI